MKKEKVKLNQFKELMKNKPQSYEVMVYPIGVGKRKMTDTRPRSKKHTIDELWNLVTDGFRQVETRLDRVEARLDYNNLKKLPDNYKVER